MRCLSLSNLNRRSRIVTLAACLMAAFATSTARADEGAASAVPTKVRALMITGGCCHDYQNQKQIISECLSEQTGPIDWTILQYGEGRDIKAEIYRDGDWIEGYDIVIHNECFGGVEDAAFVRGIVDAHRRTGIPAIMIHCSMHSYRAAPNADAWRELLGVTSRRHEKSKHSMTVVPHSRATGREGTRDDPTGGIRSRVSRILGDRWATPNGELYLIERVWPSTTVLATAHSDQTDSDHPVIWVNQLDSLRVFGTSLGHHNETMESENWQAIVAAGFDWCLHRSGR